MRRFGLSVAVPVAAVPVVAGNAPGAVPGVDVYVVEHDDAFFVTSSAMNSCIVYGLKTNWGWLSALKRRGKCLCDFFFFLEFSR